jgi:hypothetical protein
MIFLKIRGIYTTALTRLVLDLGYGIAEPSREICERFKVPQNNVDGDISIRDRDDGQGIWVSGNEGPLEELIGRFGKVLLDMVVRRDPVPVDGVSSEPGTVAWGVEFPGAAKAFLDTQRARVLPTMRGHHRLRIVASDNLDQIERQIGESPHRRDKLEREFMDRSIYKPLQKNGVLGLVHVKPEGEVIALREGEIVSRKTDSLVIKRQFQGGRYDGLDLPIQSGDYGITEITPGAWFLRHRYFTKRGEFKGEYINVNTPIELYPDHIRYVDLHVDVVKRKGETPRIIDEDQLESITKEGFISPRLREKATNVSRKLLARIIHERFRQE